MTTFHRQNLATQVFETAGQIEWLSNTNATIYFGVEQVYSDVWCVVDCLCITTRRISESCGSQKKPVARKSIVVPCRIADLTPFRSRRFKAGGSEYKWKISEDNINIFVRSFLLVSSAAMLTTRSVLIREAELWQNGYRKKSVSTSQLRSSTFSTVWS